MNDNKHIKFKRLAEARTNEIINKIRILGNCSNRSSYDYSGEDVAKIFNAIDKFLKETRTKFTFPKNDKFKL